MSEPISINEFKHELGNSVRCINCQTFIADDTTTCPDCGLHFNGPASEFCPPVDPSTAPPQAIRRRRTHLTFKITALLVILLMLYWIFIEPAGLDWF